MEAGPRLIIKPGAFAGSHVENVALETFVLVPQTTSGVLLPSFVPRPPFLPPLSASFGFSCPDPLIKIFSILYLLQVAPELL